MIPTIPPAALLPGGPPAGAAPPVPRLPKGARVFSICRNVVAGKPCITVLPQEAATAAGLHEILVARSFQSAFRKAMDLAGWGGPARLDAEEPAA